MRRPGTRTWGPTGRRAGSYRPPSSSPRPDVIERPWELLRRRATRNRPFGTPADLKRSLRAGLCHFRTARGGIRILIAGCYARPQDQSVTTGT